MTTRVTSVRVDPHVWSKLKPVASGQELTAQAALRALIRAYNQGRLSVPNERPAPGKSQSMRIDSADWAALHETAKRNGTNANRVVALLAREYVEGRIAIKVRFEVEQHAIPAG